MHHHNYNGHQQPQGHHPPAKEQEDGTPATSDFVKKLFKSVLSLPRLSVTVLIKVH
jgi:hypothetical protein